MGGSGTIRTQWNLITSGTAARVESYTGNGTSGVFIWGAQLVEGTDAKPYFATTNRQDVPRLDYRNADGTLNSCPRLLLEPQRTNSIRNSTMVGAVAGSPGTAPTNWATATSGLTQTIVGIGVESGLQYIDFRFNGTSTGTTVTIQQEGVLTVAASVSQVWTSSLYSKVISAPTPPTSYQIRLREGTSGGSFVADGLQTFVPTSSLQRFAFTRTNTGATTAFLQPSIVININNGATYDFTIRIAAPQMELGATASTFIPTTTAAVTRVIDDARKTGVASLIGQTQGTVYMEVSLRDQNIGSFRRLITLSNGTVNNRIQINTTDTNSRLQLTITTGGATQAAILSASPFSGVVKVAVAYDVNDIAFYANGVPIGTDTSASIPACDQINLGAAFDGGNPFNDSIAQAALFKTRLTNAQLAEITTI